MAAAGPDCCRAAGPPAQSARPRPPPARTPPIQVGGVGEDARLGGQIQRHLPERRDVRRRAQRHLHRLPARRDEQVDAQAVEEAPLAGDVASERPASRPRRVQPAAPDADVHNGVLYNLSFGSGLPEFTR